MPYQDETEADTIANRIRPVLEEAGWGRVDGAHIRAEVICPGRILLGGKRDHALSCDLVLEYKGQKLATIEAKKASLSYREGVEQTKNYAKRLGSRFAYASNGLVWYQIDMATAKEGKHELPFPTPDELWSRSFEKDNQWRENFAKVPFEKAGGKWEPRYYQHRAITATLEAIAEGKKRILLTLATGTGKTSIAFQIAWKLFRSKWNLSGEATRRPRILFLADRNILADQAVNEFSAFSKSAISRISPDGVRKKGAAPKNASVFFTIFQTFMAGEPNPVYKDYPPDFFDFIIIDECHRGGAKDESEWRGIMEYFKPAVQLGLTATPKRRANADSYAYFGEPVYSYALKDGIADGFLTPFKVRQMVSTIDEYVYTGEDELEQGEVKIGARYKEGDFNRRIIMEERELSRVKEFMAEINQDEKTLVFCATQNHAAMVRDLINQVKRSEEVDYCQRVTADDGDGGEQYLRDFQDNDKTIPTMLTTSQKLSTGVNARNVRNIVLMRPVKSIIEFKQIVGRGTRIYEGKDYFTIWDFVKAYENFNDPEWDGEPVEPVVSGGEGGGEGGGDEPSSPAPPPIDKPPQHEKIVITLADGKERHIQYLKSTIYTGRDGKPMSAKAFFEMLFGELNGLIRSEDQLRKIWSNPETRQHFMAQLSERGYVREELDDVKTLVDAPNSDLFDVLGYILFALKPLTREQRADNVKKNGLEVAGEEMQSFLSRILNSYINSGEDELSAERLEQHIRAAYGSVGEGKHKLGKVAMVKGAYLQMQEKLYE
ncbi:MAG: EcoAI/FtnUII family type I restriction enzme subunit R [Parvibaculales bacterium]